MSVKYKYSQILIQCAFPGALVIVNALRILGRVPLVRGWAGVGDDCKYKIFNDPAGSPMLFKRRARTFK